MSSEDKLAAWDLESMSLDVEQLLDLSSIYGFILRDHKDLVQMALAKKVTVAQAYADVCRAQRAIAERVTQLKKKEAEKK